jgi:hypothetical protein
MESCIVHPNRGQCNKPTLCYHLYNIQIQQSIAKKQLHFRVAAVVAKPYLARFFFICFSNFITVQMHTYIFHGNAAPTGNLCYKFLIESGSLSHRRSGP